MRTLLIATLLSLSLPALAQTAAKAPGDDKSRALKLSDPHVQPSPGAGLPADMQWVPVNGPLFGPSTPGASEVIQGHAGDCTMISIMSDIARMHPEHWRQTISDNGNGTYVVTLYEGEPPHPVQVAVDNKMPMSKGVLINTKQPHSKAIWALVVEKAVAKLRGSYDLLEGHTPGQLATLTGWRAMHVPMPPTPDELFETLTKATQQHRIVMISTLDTKKFAALPKELQAGFAAYHEISVLGTAQQNGKQILVRNPWGNATQVGDGFSWIPLGNFVRMFSGLTVGGPDI